MAVMFAVSINAPTAGSGRLSSECDYVIRLLNEVIKEFGKGRGTIVSGVIGSYDNTLDSPTSQGSWTYTAVATTP